MSRIIAFLALTLLTACSASSQGPKAPVAAIQKGSLLLIVIDKSGSMREDKKIVFARKAAQDAIQTLSESDSVSVIGFDAAPFRLIDVVSVSNARELAKKRLPLLIPSGRTFPLTALGESRLAMERHPHEHMHLLLLSDGRIPEPHQAILEEVQKIRALGASVSTVRFGKDGDRGLMRKIAESGSGSLYVADKAESLPAIFVRDVKSFVGQ